MNKTAPEIPKYLNRSEAASYLGVSATALARWASERRGPSYYRLGRKALYRADDLEAFLAKKRREA